MKKSQQVILTSVLFFGIMACKDEPKDEWINGNDPSGRTRDTMVNNNHYRYFGGFWYPVFAGRINPYAYRGASAHEISRPGFTPSRTVRTGGFGSTSTTGARS